MLSAIILNDVMLSDVMLNVVVLNVVAPTKLPTNFLRSFVANDFLIVKVGLNL